jgi:hypothetical protein
MGITSAIDKAPARATAVHLTDDALVVDLVDGRSVSAPLAWYPRLLHGSTSERSSYQLIGFWRRNSLADAR